MPVLLSDVDFPNAEREKDLVGYLERDLERDGEIFPTADVVSFSDIVGLDVLNEDVGRVAVRMFEPEDVALLSGVPLTVTVPVRERLLVGEFAVTEAERKNVIDFDSVGAVRL